jgi:hypothetical protein
VIRDLSHGEFIAHTLLPLRYHRVLISEVKMTTSQPLPLAVASLKSAISWTWQLKIDETGLYRWYLDGAMRTQLRGCTRTLAEAALRRFVEDSLRGELEIVDAPEGISQ